MVRLERGLKPLPNEFQRNYHNINLTTNYQLLLNCNKVHRAVQSVDEHRCLGLRDKY
jgi:hypothetical protein